MVDKEVRRNLKNEFNFNAGNNSYEWPDQNQPHISLRVKAAEAWLKIWKCIYFTFIPLFRLPKVAFDNRHKKWIYLNNRNTWSFIFE